MPIGECQFFLGNASCDVNEIYARGLTPEQMAEAVLDVDALYDRAISAVMVLPRKTAFQRQKTAVAKQQKSRTEYPRGAQAFRPVFRRVNAAIIIEALPGQI